MRDSFEHVYRAQRKSMIGWLRGCYPGSPVAELEDAVASAFCVGLTRRDDLAADDEFARFVRTVAWREARNAWRKRSSARRAATHHPGMPADPRGRLEARHALARLDGLVDQAAQRHGGQQQAAVCLALRDRLGGMSDTEAARRHGVRREYVNRARRWMLTQLDPRIES